MRRFDYQIGRVGDEAFDARTGRIRGGGDSVTYEDSPILAVAAPDHAGALRAVKARILAQAEEDRWYLEAESPKIIRARIRESAVGTDGWDDAAYHEFTIGSRVVYDVVEDRPVAATLKVDMTRGDYDQAVDGVIGNDPVAIAVDRAAAAAGIGYADWAMLTPSDAKIEVRRADGAVRTMKARLPEKVQRWLEKYEEGAGLDVLDEAFELEFRPV